MEIRVVTTDANAVVLVGGQRVAGPGMPTGTPTVPENVPVAGLPLWTNMDPQYEGAHKGRYFVHGPAVGFNAEGQPIDAQGRTAGPKPKQPGESETGTIFRVGVVRGPNDPDTPYDAWGNRLEQLSTFHPAPVYPNEMALFDALIANNYNVAVHLTRADGTYRVYPGLSPADQWVEQPDKTVVKTN